MPRLLVLFYCSLLLCACASRPLEPMPAPQAAPPLPQPSESWQQLMTNINALREEGDLVAAQRDAESALTLVLADVGQWHEATALTLETLGMLALLQEALPEAVDYYTQALAVRERTQGMDAMVLRNDLNTLGMLYRRLEQPIAAEAAYLRALAIWQQHETEDAPPLDPTLTGLAWLTHHQGRLAEAEQYYQRLIALWEAVDTEHPGAVWALGNLGVLHLLEGRFESAERLLLRALALRETVEGVDHPNQLTTLQRLQALYRATGRDAEAEALAARIASMVTEE